MIDWSLISVLPHINNISAIKGSDYEKQEANGPHHSPNLRNSSNKNAHLQKSMIKLNKETKTLSQPF